MAEDVSEAARRCSFARHLQPGLAALDPEQLEQGFAAWVGSIARLTAAEVVAIDGKALCGTREGGKKALVHMVSAWACANNLVLAQRKVDEKSNEITAIPKLLNALALQGAVVTIDAAGCQREIANRIVARQADYVLAVKGNQGLLAEQVRDSFMLLKCTAAAEEIDCGHGRVERRTCSVMADLSMIERPANERLYRVWCGSRPNATTRPRARPNAKPVSTSPASHPMRRG